MDISPDGAEGWVDAKERPCPLCRQTVSLFALKMVRTGQRTDEIWPAKHGLTRDVQPRDFLVVQSCPKS